MYPEFSSLKHIAFLRNCPYQAHTRKLVAQLNVEGWQKSFISNSREKFWLELKNFEEKFLQDATQAYFTEITQKKTDSQKKVKVTDIVEFLR